MLSRPRFASNPSGATEGRSVESILFDDPLGEVLDVLGINEYVGWYVGKPEDADRLQWNIKWPKPVIISEFGAEALAGFHADAETRFSEEYQSRVYEHQLAMMRRVPRFAGMTPWLLMDFRSPGARLPAFRTITTARVCSPTVVKRSRHFTSCRNFIATLGRELRRSKNSMQVRATPGRRL